MSDAVERGEGGPLLVFLNEAAGGRRLLEAVRERANGASQLVVTAPSNQPATGQLTGPGKRREAARARVEATMSLFAELGIDTVGEVMDPDPALALDDAVRAHEPAEVLISCREETRFGLTRKDLVAWARRRFEPEVTVTHVPVRPAEGEGS